MLSNMKDVREPETMRNAIFKTKCNDCEFSCTNVTFRNMDVQRSHERLTNRTHSAMTIHLQEFPGHCFDPDVEIIKVFHNNWDLEHAEWILGDIMKIKGHGKRKGHRRMMCDS